MNGAGLDVVVSYSTDIPNDHRKLTTKTEHQFSIPIGILRPPVINHHSHWNRRMVLNDKHGSHRDWKTGKTWKNNVMIRKKMFQGTNIFLYCSNTITNFFKSSWLWFGSGSL